MSLFFHRYELHPRSPLNARQDSATPRCGALLRRKEGGIGCLQPWPELGDATLDEELAALADGAPAPLGTNALECARLDGEARAAGQPLFAWRSVPMSHWSASEGDQPGAVAALGFDRVKIKIAADRPEEAQKEMRRWVSAAGGFRLRLDANESFDEEGFRIFCDQLDPAVSDAIEFVEDPVPYDEKSWQDLEDEGGPPLAIDRAIDVSTHRVTVIKPAVMSMGTWTRRLEHAGARLVFTTYLDHAVGQAWACYAAAKCAASRPERVLPCGLVSHPRYEPDAFFESLEIREGRTVYPSGSGLGFDALVERLPWKRLL